jgi:hypothetical protein
MEVNTPSSCIDVDQSQDEFVGRWRRLVSSTNWEKGRIIREWRDALSAAGEPVASYSDDVWSQTIGGVSPQHVGRLRRTHERFSAVKDSYAGLFWSHFQAALDWDDAEMWLEGAVQSRWTVAQMRQQRSEAMGGQEPPSGGLDSSACEDGTPLDEDSDGPVAWDGVSRTAEPEVAEVYDPASIGDEDAPFDETERTNADGELGNTEGSPTRPRVRPFAELPSLTADLDEAFESCKLAILRHKLGGWKEVNPEDVVLHLRALEELILAPRICEVGEPFFFWGV